MPLPMSTIFDIVADGGGVAVVVVVLAVVVDSVNYLDAPSMLRQHRQVCQGHGK